MLLRPAITLRFPCAVKALNRPSTYLEAMRLSVDTVIDLALRKFNLRPRLQFHEEEGLASLNFKPC